MGWRHRAVRRCRERVRFGDGNGHGHAGNGAGNNGNGHGNDDTEPLPQRAFTGNTAHKLDAHENHLDLPAFLRRQAD